MLHVYNSNRLEKLAERAAELLRQPGQPGDWLHGELIAVENRGMARWLSMQLAQHLGVAANIDYRLPAAFIWTLLRKALPKLPLQSSYSPQLLAWRLLQRLLRPDSLPPELRAAVRASDGVGLYLLAKRLAECYDQYMLFRPDWIEEWQRQEPPDNWQAQLWRELREQDDGPHWLAACDMLRQLPGFAQGDGAPAELSLPPRLFLFGISTLSPSYLQVLHAFARHSEMHLFVLNPCRQYWGDIYSRKQVAKQEARDSKTLQYGETGHQLLASLGGQGREFADNIQDSAEQSGGMDEQDLYVDPGAGTMLRRLQQDMLDLRESRGAGGDHSIQVHICHSMRREVEALHDQLLHMFSSHPGLGPSDVMVMAPDIESYAPYIDAVFATSRQKLPYGIADRGGGGGFGASELLLKLLELEGSRLLASEWAQLLQLPECAARFGIGAEQIPDIEECLAQAGVRWGMDVAHREQHGVHMGEENTWRHGMERLLLGYAAGSDMREYQQLPAAEAGSDYSEVTGGICAWLDRLDYWRRELPRPRPLRQWAESLGRLRDDFLDGDAADRDELQLINDAIEELHSEGEVTSCDIPVAEIRACLQDRLRAAADSSSFAGRGITFCRMVPMRSIPFKVVCIMGMSFDAYPRAHHPPDFDLMLEQPRPGDRSRRNDDRYLFLEAIGAAREMLYISYVGRSAKDNSELPPSVLLNELLDAVSLQGGEAKSIQTEHRLQSFHPEHFTGEGRRFSYDQGAAQLASVCGSREDNPFLKGPLQSQAPLPESVQLAELKGFFRDPQRHFLRNALNIRRPYAAEELPPSESFAMDKWQGVDLMRALLRSLGEGGEGQAQSLIRRYRSDGLLPPPPVGELLLQQPISQVRNFMGQMDPASLKQALDDNVDAISVATANCSLRGELPKAPMRHVHATEPNEYDIVQCWLQHLLSCVAGVAEEGRCDYIKRDGTPGCQRWLVPEDPRRLLRQLLDLYLQGCVNPLCYSPRLSQAYCEARSDDEKDKVGKALDLWHGNPNARGLRENFHLSLLWRDQDMEKLFCGKEFKEQSEAVCLPMLEHRHR